MLSTGSFYFSVKIGYTWWSSSLFITIGQVKLGCIGCWVAPHVWCKGKIEWIYIQRYMEGHKNSLLLYGQTFFIKRNQPQIISGPIGSFTVKVQQLARCFPTDNNSLLLYILYYYRIVLRYDFSDYWLSTL